MRRLALVLAAVVAALGVFAASPGGRTVAHASTVNCGQSTTHDEWMDPVGSGAQGAEHFIQATLSVQCIFNGDGSYYAKYQLEVNDIQGNSIMTSMDAQVRVWSSCVNFYYPYASALRSYNGQYLYTTHGPGNPPDWVYYPPGCGPQADDGGAFLWSSTEWYYWVPYVTTA